MADLKDPTPEDSPTTTMQNKTKVEEESKPQGIFISHRKAAAIAVLFVIISVLIGTLTWFFVDEYKDDDDDDDCKDIYKRQFVPRSNICDSCSNTAMLALEAAELNIRSSYANELAKASLIEDEDESQEAIDEATQSRDEELEDLDRVNEGRLNLCEKLNECFYSPVIDPANFLSPAEASSNPNPFFPLVIGNEYLYHAQVEEGLEEIVFTVTGETREILGVICTEIRDIVTIAGELHEDTKDWYAQDRDGNVWYFGEVVLNYGGGKVEDLDGSWEAGEDGSQPGIIMLAEPKVGNVYREELHLNNAEDYAEILSITATATANGVEYNNCVQTLNGSPSEPVVEHKFWCRGIGSVLEVNPDSGESLELISFNNTLAV